MASTGRTSRRTGGGWPAPATTAPCGFGTLKATRMTRSSSLAARVAALAWGPAGISLASASAFVQLSLIARDGSPPRRATPAPRGPRTDRSPRAYGTATRSRSCSWSVFERPIVTRSPCAGSKERSSTSSATSSERLSAVATRAAASWKLHVACHVFDVHPWGRRFRGRVLT